MTLFMHALILGYGVAALAALRLADAGLALWAVLLVAWIGGNALGLAFTWIGAWLWPAMPARRSSFTATAAEFGLWDEDLLLERINAGLRRDPVCRDQGRHDHGPVPAVAPEQVRREAG